MRDLIIGIIMSILIATTAAVAIAGVSMWHDSRECSANGGTYSVGGLDTGILTVCHY